MMPAAVATRDPLIEALSDATYDQIIFDLAGIQDRGVTLRQELPGVRIRFALKACPVDEVVGALAQMGAGVDAASPHEVTQAIRVGVPAERIHYGNTIKSDGDIAETYHLGIRDFATDSIADVDAIAAYAPNSRVFCRLATTGKGALWGLSNKFGCSSDDAVHVLAHAVESGLQPAGLSVHVGSQQMTIEAWEGAFEILAVTMTELLLKGISLRYINLGGGIPALGYLDRDGMPLSPPIADIFAAIRSGMHRLRLLHGSELDFIVEPGRHLVADHGAVRAQVVRLTERQQPDGSRQRWLYLSCGKFNGLYEMDALQYRIVFPGHDGEHVPAVLAGPSCDSDDAYACDGGFTSVPKDLKSGDPVWLLSCGAYSVSYTTQGFNGFKPLPLSWASAPNRISERRTDSPVAAHQPTWERHS